MAEFKDVAVSPATIFPSPMIIPLLIFLWHVLHKFSKMSKETITSSSTVGDALSAQQLRNKSGSLRKKAFTNAG
jgi:hypothetical protein